MNAHIKDKLENKMHSLVCNGKLDIKQAQQEIAKDWIAAYAKYIGPVPGGSPATATPAATPQAERPATPPNAVPTGASTEEVKPDASGGCPADAPVKISKNGVAHAPGGASYDRTHAKHCFASQGAAEAAGYRAAKR